MQIFNGTPVPVKARAEGMIYVITPGAILDIEQADRGRTILNNYQALREVKFGDDLEELAEESLALWCAHVLQQVEEQNQFNLEQAKQGLKPAATNKQLQGFLKLVEDRTGEKLELTHEDGDPLLGAIRMVGSAVKRMKEDGPKKQKLVTVLEQLVAAKGDKGQHVEEKRAAIIGAAELSGQTVTAAVKARRAGRIRHARQEKGGK